MSPAPTRRLLITGVTGLLGSNLALEARRSYEVHGLARNPGAFPKWKDVRTHSVDLMDSGWTLKCLQEIRPEAVIHAAADAQVDHCDKEPDFARRMNVEVPGHIAQHCKTLGIRLIHISTDAFFDRPNHRFTEEETPTPLSVYGQTKWDGENAVLQAMPEALVARTNFFGWNPRGAIGLAEWIVQRLVNQVETPLFTNVSYTPIEVRTLSRVLLQLTELPASGILHVAGSDVVSKWDFARILAETLGLSLACAKPTAYQPGMLAARRANDMALSTEKLRKLLPSANLSLASGVGLMKQSLDDGHASEIKGQPWSLEKYRTA
jgi:dTDP-4-dehydrorhamnose reductase